MSMSEEHRAAIVAANKKRSSHLCQRCGNGPVSVRDGAEIGGLPGVKYRCCAVCGFERAITHRPRRLKL